jgi:peptidoglycan/LPS O-acetylase OafA/YrhL
VTVTASPTNERRRPEIQALRAFAVLAVVLYHLWPVVLTGGFVGVDVFFVISGFLITGHLLREVDRTGRIRLGQFWARRARRLLPAALLVLLVTGIAVIVWVPRIFWLQFFREAIASALYVENWALAADSVNYLAESNAPSAVQHYWSLSVEEQFYVLWPLLILLALAIAAGLRILRKRRVVVILLGVVVAASFAYSIWITQASPAAAYFVTPARAWEFGVGGLLAMVPPLVFAGRERLRAAAAWVGWIVLVAVIVRYSASTPFPGWTAAVPVGATMLVIAAGTPSVRWSPSFLVGLRPVQWVGDVSYSLYLWHWPLIIVAPYVLGYAQLAIVEKTAILVIAGVLAWLTRRFVEDPVRRAPLLAARRPRWTLLFSLVAMAVIVLPSIAGGQIVTAQVAQADGIRAELAKSPCFGAASLDPDRDCSKAAFPVISPDPALAPQDSPSIYFTDPPCPVSGTEATSCSFGDPHGAFRVALVGDSHAAQWEPALRRIAEANGWNLVLYIKTNCAFSDATRTKAYADCATWSHNVSAALAAQKPFDLVITGFFAENLGLEVDAKQVSTSAAEAGFADVWAPLIARGSTVVAIRDTPHMRQSTTVCVAQHGGSSQCTVPVAEAQSRTDLQYEAARSVPGAVGLDMSRLFCTSSTCLAVAGGVAMHTDPFHMTATYSRTTAPYLLRSLASRLGAADPDSATALELSRAHNSD